MCDLDDVSTRTVRRSMNRAGYRYLQARKKGLLSPADLKIRTEFAKFSYNSLANDFWTRRICFYADGVSFAHKFNPRDSAITAQSMVWRKSGEGLSITTKGSKVGVGTPRIFKLMVGIAYNVGVVLCVEVPSKMTGKEFATIIREHYPAALQRCNMQELPLMLQVTYSLKWSLYRISEQQWL